MTFEEIKKIFDKLEEDYIKDRNKHPDDLVQLKAALKKFEIGLNKLASEIKQELQGPNKEAPVVENFFVEYVREYLFVQIAFIAIESEKQNANTDGNDSVIQEITQFIEGLDNPEKLTQENFKNFIQKINNLEEAIKQKLPEDKKEQWKQKMNGHYQNLEEKYEFLQNIYFSPDEDEEDEDLEALIVINNENTPITREELSAFIKEIESQRFTSETLNSDKIDELIASETNQPHVFKSRTQEITVENLAFAESNLHTSFQFKHAPSSQDYKTVFMASLAKAWAAPQNKDMKSLTFIIPGFTGDIDNFLSAACEVMQQQAQEDKLVKILLTENIPALKFKDKKGEIFPPDIIKIQEYNQMLEDFYAALEQDKNAAYPPELKLKPKRIETINLSNNASFFVRESSDDTPGPPTDEEHDSTMNPHS